jgi:hypothetical protein
MTRRKKNVGLARVAAAGVSFDELVLDMSEDQMAPLREALQRRRGG